MRPVLGALLAMAFLPPAARADAAPTPAASPRPAAAVDVGAGVDCAAGVASAFRRANALPATPGRAALLEQVQRAQIAHHEDDDDECREQLRIATDVLDRIDASRRASGGGASHPGR